MRIPDTLKWKSIGRTLGRGGQAQVEVVIDKTAGDEEPYALKALAPDRPKHAYERFSREIEAIKQVNHPGVIKIFDHSEPGDSFQYYVMEYIQGITSLKHFLESDNNPYHCDPLKSLELFIKIVEATEACSQVGIVHRDLSPANILIRDDESIKIIDFGLCHVVQGKTITLTDEAVGTPNYRPPECEGHTTLKPDWRSDLYSVGKIVWSAITCQFAFARERPVFKDCSMPSLFPEHPDTWHLQSIFLKTIRGNPGDRWHEPAEALKRARKVSFLISAGYPPLELIEKTCPICGLGSLEKFVASVLFNNPMPQGFDRLMCDRCGFCFARNREIMKKSLEERYPKE